MYKGYKISKRLERYISYAKQNIKSSMYITMLTYGKY